MKNPELDHSSERNDSPDPFSAHLAFLQKLSGGTRGATESLFAFDDQVPHVESLADITDRQHEEQMIAQMM